MPVVPTGEILAAAYRDRYGVAAINVVNDLTLEAVLAAATEQRAPLIVQTSVKTVRSIGYDVLYGMWTTMTADVPVPVSLHLDHCPDRDVISRCLKTGWNSVLFDASRLPIEENQRQTVEVVAEAGQYGAQVEGEVESITGVEDGIGSDQEAARQDLDDVVRFIETTGVDVFAPAIGNAHGGAASTIGDKSEVDGDTLVAALRAAAQGVMARGKAELGDKTLLDALVPATDALEEALRSGSADPAQAFATTARERADATKTMQARRGRASYTGERSIGSVDAGATAVAVMAEQIAAGWATRR